MKVKPVRLKKIIQKSSFNYRLTSTRILFKAGKISSKMISPDHTYAVLINMPNDVLTGVKRKNEVELCFDLSNKQFSRRVFHQFDSDECEAKITENHFIISDNGEMTARFGQSMIDDIFLRDDLPRFESTTETLIDIDLDLIKAVLKYCKAASKSKVNAIQFILKKGATYIGFKKDDITKVMTQIEGIKIKKSRKDFSMSFNRTDLKTVFNLIKPDKQKTYQLKTVYDDSKKSGYASVVSKDGTEQYILYSKRVNKTGELIKLEKKIERTPPIPEKWNYDESVKKVKGNFYKWKNLTNEIYTELWVAREILSKSKSEAAMIMHGTLVPWMTWTQYCEDIGSSRQVVNRWLKQSFENNILKDNDEKSIPDEFFKAVQKVVGKGKDKFVDAYSGRKAPEQIEKLMQDIESGSAKEAIVHVNNNYTYRNWFKPLFDGYICFGNGNKQGSCFVYFGEKQDKFVSEFSKHGVVMAKVE